MLGDVSSRPGSFPTRSLFMRMQPIFWPSHTYPEVAESGGQSVEPLHTEGQMHKRTDSLDTEPLMSDSAPSDLPRVSAGAPLLPPNGTKTTCSPAHRAPMETPRKTSPIYVLFNCETQSRSSPQRASDPATGIGSQKCARDTSCRLEWSRHLIIPARTIATLISRLIGRPEFTFHLSMPLSTGRYEYDLQLSRSQAMQARDNNTM